MLCLCSMLSWFTLTALFVLISIIQKCREIKNVSDSIRMKIFIEILIDIFESTIKFKKTKSQPLLPYQTVIQPNKFKDEIIGLIKYYGVEIDSNGINPIKVGKTYQKDSQRSRKISNSYKNALISVQQLLDNNDQCPFYELSPNIGTHYHIQQAGKYSLKNTTFKPWLDYKSIECVNNNKDENSAQFNEDQTKIKQENLSARTNHNLFQRMCLDRKQSMLIDAPSDITKSTINGEINARTKTTQDNRLMASIQTNLCDIAQIQNINNLNNPIYINNNLGNVSYEQLLTNLVQNCYNNDDRKLSTQLIPNQVINPITNISQLQTELLQQLLSPNKNIINPNMIILSNGNLFKLTFNLQ